MGSEGPAPSQISTVPKIDDNDMSHFAEPQPLPAANGLVKYWLLTATGATTATLNMQWLPLH